MKKVSNIIVEKRYWILGVMMCLTIICSILGNQVSVNTDMTKYLPDNSSMKIGTELMDEEFSELNSDSSIRVMAENLSDEQKNNLLKKLKNIQYVKDVSYNKSDDYNSGIYSLFVVSTTYEYGSEEELSIEETLDNDFSEYNIVWKNNNDDFEGLPRSLQMIEIALLVTILLIMSGSWIEPFLFLITIGFAIVLNSGTNISLGEISNVTSSVTTILQLVLSMDYSIILINRYRQEKCSGISKEAAMKEAVTHAFSSIASSSMTTVVGLLTLVFMKFKIGLDLGIVLAKGVFLSAVCVITLLPCLILMCDKLITKTAKKAPSIPVGRVANFCYRIRYVMLALFVVAFVGFYTMQGNTEIAYTLESEDPIADIFPNENMVVMVYDNEDEDKAAKLAEAYESDNSVEQVLSYPTLLGKSYTVEELSDAIEDLDDTFDMGGNFDMDSSLDIDEELDPSMLRLIYYHYYDGESVPMTMKEFLGFLLDDVVNNDSFSDNIDDDIREQVDTLRKFSDPDKLTKPKSSKELASFLDMDKKTVKKLLLYYYIQHGGVGTGTMSLPEFVSFITKDIANDPDYNSVFDDKVLSEMEKLKSFTNSSSVNSPMTIKEIAGKLEMDEKTVELLFVYYQASKSGYQPKSMTLPEFFHFLQTDIMKNPTFSSNFNKKTKTQINEMKLYIDKAALKKHCSSSKIAKTLGLKKSMADMIFSLYYAKDVGDKSMTLSQFCAFLNDDILSNTMFAKSFDKNKKVQIKQMNEVVSAAASGKKFSATKLAAITQMKEDDIKKIFAAVSGQTGEAVKSMTLPEFLQVVTTAAPDNQQLQKLKKIVQLAASKKKLNVSSLATTLGMDKSMTTLIFRLFYGGRTTDKKMSVQQTVDFLLNDKTMSSYLDKNTKNKLKTADKLITATIGDKKLSYPELAKLLGMDSSMLKILFTYHDAQDGMADRWELSLRSVVNFLLDNKEISKEMDTNDKKQLSTAKQIIDGALSGRKYSVEELASLLDKKTSDLEPIFLLYKSENDDTKDWKISVQALVSFLNKDILTDEELSDQIDENSAKELSGAENLINAVVSDKKYHSQEVFSILESLSDELDKNTVDMLFFYHAAQNYFNTDWTISIDELFHYLKNTFLADERFSSFIDKDLRNNINDTEKELDEGIGMLKTKRYSRMVFFTDFPIESEQTTQFISNLEKESEDFVGEHYLIGNSVLSYEMQQTFDKELQTITLLTATAIFIIVALSFHSLVIPLLLVLLVQCSVYITVTVVGLQGYSIYFLALLIVECILMGATIDYGILFMNYYREKRREMEKKEALTAAYNGSIHTIMTSGMIIILVTGIIGYTISDPTIGQITRTISTGALCAILMILFVLPSLIIIFDKFVAHVSEK